MRYSQGRPYWGPPQRDSFYPSLYYYCYTHLHARTLPPALSGRHQGRHRGQHLDRRRGQHRGRHVEEAKVRKAIRQLKLQPWSIHVTKIPGKSSNEEIYRELREWYRRVAKSTLQCSDQDDRLLLPDHLLGPPFRSNNRDTVRVHVTLKDKAMRRELLQNRDDNNDFYGDGSTKIEIEEFKTILERRGESTRAVPHEDESANSIASDVVERETEVQSTPSGEM